MLLPPWNYAGMMGMGMGSMNGGMGMSAMSGMGSMNGGMGMSAMSPMGSMNTAGMNVAMSSDLYGGKTMVDGTTHPAMGCREGGRVQMGLAWVCLFCHKRECARGSRSLCLE